MGDVQIIAVNNCSFLYSITSNDKSQLPLSKEVLNSLYFIYLSLMDLQILLYLCAIYLKRA